MNIAALPTIPWRAKSSLNLGRDPTMPRETRMAHLAEKMSTDSTESRLTGAYLVIALLALFVGVVTGLFQALSHAGVNLYPHADTGGSLILPGAHLTWGHERPRLDDVFYLWLLTVHGHAGFWHTVGEPCPGLDDVRPDDGWTRSGSYSPPEQRSHGHVYVLFAFEGPLGCLFWVVGW